MKGLLFVLIVAASGIARGEEPNIVLILSDDVGYGDVGCYGATTVRTPNIDSLSRDGRRFTDAHSPASTCTPTRRALLTGTYSWRQIPGSAIAPGDAAITISPGTVTLPSLLKLAGYTTGAVGKWHLGLGGEGGPDWNGEIRPGPLELGFDYAFFMPATGDRVPCVYIEDHRIVGLDPLDPICVSYREKIGTDPTGRENPELLKLRHTHGHDGTIVNGIGRIGWMTGGKSARWLDEKMADTWAAQAIGFIERSRDRPFFLYLATHGIHVPRVPAPRFRDTSQSGTRGDAIDELDDTVGQILAALDRLKLTEKTLVIFTSDNGGVIDDGYEDFGPARQRPNGVLRGFKGSVFEGGHRIPFIARWPGHIAAGSECDELITLLDLPATLGSLTGIPLPEQGTLDSLDLLPALLGQPHAQPLRRDFIAHNGGINGPFGIRDGQWKLVTGTGGYGGQKQAATPQLFDLSTDLAETTDLAAAHPEIVKRLLALLERQRAAGRTRPVP